MGKFIDLTGQKFGRLKVIERAENFGKRTMWKCECKCGNIVVVRQDYLSGSVLPSCGCYLKEKAAENGKLNKKYNKYDLSNIYGIGYTTNTKKTFIFDLSDYELIKEYAWAENDQGYIVTKIEDKSIRIHRLITDCPNSMSVDHINGDTLDNRKINLRMCENKDNVKNSRISKNNTTGYKGVTYDKNRGKYIAQIMIDRKHIALGRYDSPELAYIAYCNAADKYFGKYANYG
jgi:hypothetical protein